MDFRQRIKDICQRKGITQKELAEKLGITDISLNKTLRGEYPQLQSLEKIAIALEIPITELFVPQREGITGYIEYEGEVRKINSVSDIEKILQEIKDK